VNSPVTACPPKDNRQIWFKWIIEQLLLGCSLLFGLTAKTAEVAKTIAAWYAFDGRSLH
jgi:hypothetical protein